MFSDMRKSLLVPSMLLSTLCAMALLTIDVSAQAILFSDDFVAPTVDTNKWTVTVTHGGGYASQGGGSLTLNHPNFQDGVFVTSIVGFTTPYKVVTSFLPDPQYSINGIVLRASGAYQPTWYYDPYGISVTFFFGTSMTINNGSPEAGFITLLEQPVTFSTTSWNNIEVSDFGDAISVSLNSVLVVDKFPVDPSLGVGNKVVLGDSDNGNFSGDIDQSSFGPVVVEAIPEPSTYALLLLSGAASLWALRRRKS